jgi:hypothetical protein
MYIVEAEVLSLCQAALARPVYRLANLVAVEPPTSHCAMCGRLRVGKENLHGASLVGAAMCSAC